MVASMLLKQVPQTSQGEHNIREGITRFEAARAKIRAYYAANRRTALEDALAMLKGGKSGKGNRKK